VDHEMLMAAIERKIKDADVLWPDRVILDLGREPEAEEAPCISRNDLFPPL